MTEISNSEAEMKPNPAIVEAARVVVDVADKRYRDGGRMLARAVDALVAAVQASPAPLDTTTSKTNCELCMEAGIAEERARTERDVRSVLDIAAKAGMPPASYAILAAIRGGDDA